MLLLHFTLIAATILILVLSAGAAVCERQMEVNSVTTPTWRHQRIES